MSPRTFLNVSIAILAHAAFVVLPLPSISSARASTCPSPAAIQQSPVSLAGVRSAHLAPVGPAALLLYGTSGVFMTRLQEDATLAPFEPVSSAVEAWPVDVNNDGREDLALQFGEDSIGIALTSHRGEPGTVSSWLSGRWLASGDLDGDHRPEIVLRGPDGSLLIAWNDRGRFSRVTNTGVVTRESPQGLVAIGKVTRGPASQIAYLSTDDNTRTLDTVRVFSASRDGSLLKVSESLVPSLWSRELGPQREMVLADVNGRGRDDLVILRGSYIGQLQVLHNSGNGFVADPATFQMDKENPHSLAMADLDGDGDLDAVCASHRDGDSSDEGFTARVQVRWNDGSGGFVETCSALASTHAFSLMAAVADLDGNGALDVGVLVGNLGGGGQAVSLLLGEGHGQGKMGGRSREPQIHGAGPLELAPRIDVVSPNPTRGTVSVQFTLGSSSPASVELFDLAGRRIHRELIPEPAKGQRSMTLRAHGISPGVYRVVVRQGEAETKRSVTVLP